VRRWLARTTLTAAGVWLAAAVVAVVLDRLARVAQIRELARLGQREAEYLRAYGEACAASPILSRAARG